MAYRHWQHPRIIERAAEGPVKVEDQHKSDTPYARFNRALALRITAMVGSMTCGYIFAVIALISLPAAIESHNVITIVAWVAQTFLQLVLLSVIIVGQNVQSSASDARAAQTFADVEAILHECLELQRHLMEQDKILTEQERVLARINDPKTNGPHPGGS